MAFFSDKIVCGHCKGLLAWPSRDIYQRWSKFSKESYAEALRIFGQDNLCYRNGSLPYGAFKIQVPFTLKMAPNPNTPISHFPPCQQSEDCAHAIWSCFSGLGKDIEAVALVLGLPVVGSVVAERCRIRRKMSGRMTSAMNIPVIYYDSVMELVTDLPEALRLTREKFRQQSGSQSRRLCHWAGGGPPCQDFVGSSLTGKVEALLGERSGCAFDFFAFVMGLNSLLEDWETLIVVMEEHAMRHWEWLLISQALGLQVYLSAPTETPCSGKRSWSVNFPVEEMEAAWTYDGTVSGIIPSGLQRNSGSHAPQLDRPMQLWRPKDGSQSGGYGRLRGARLWGRSLPQYRPSQTFRDEKVAPQAWLQHMGAPVSDLSDVENEGGWHQRQGGLWNWRLWCEAYLPLSVNVSWCPDKFMRDGNLGSWPGRSWISDLEIREAMSYPRGRVAVDDPDVPWVRSGATMVLDKIPVDPNEVAEVHWIDDSGAELPNFSGCPFRILRDGVDMWRSPGDRASLNATGETWDLHVAGPLYRAAWRCLREGKIQKVSTCTPAQLFQLALQYGIDTHQADVVRQPGFLRCLLQAVKVLDEGEVAVQCSNCAGRLPPVSVNVAFPQQKVAVVCGLCRRSADHDLKWWTKNTVPDRLFVEVLSKIE